MADDYQHNQGPDLQRGDQLIGDNGDGTSTIMRDGQLHRVMNDAPAAHRQQTLEQPVELQDNLAHGHAETHEQRHLRLRWEKAEAEELKLEQLAQQQMPPPQQPKRGPVKRIVRTLEKRTKKILDKDAIDLVVVFDATASRSDTMQKALLSMVEAYQKQLRKMIRAGVGKPKLRINFIRHDGAGVHGESGWLSNIRSLRDYVSGIGNIAGGTSWVRAFSDANRIKSDALIAIGDYCEDGDPSAQLNANFSSPDKAARRAFYALWDNGSLWRAPEMAPFRKAVRTSKEKTGKGKVFMLGNKIDLSELIDDMFKIVEEYVPVDRIVTDYSEDAPSP